MMVMYYYYYDYVIMISVIMAIVVKCSLGTGPTNWFVEKQD